MRTTFVWLIFATAVSAQLSWTEQIAIDGERPGRRLKARGLGLAATQTDPGHLDPPRTLCGRRTAARSLVRPCTPCQTR